MYDLGDYIVELEVPDGTSMTLAGEHVDLHGMSPTELCHWVVATRPLDGDG